MSAPYPTSIINHRSAFSPAVKNQVRYASGIEHELTKKRQIIDELADVGVQKFTHTRAEGRELHHILHDDEHIMGVTYGHYARGFGMLVATNKRILFVDKKFMYIEVDEVAYELVGGVSYQRSGLFGTITLHTRIGDYKIRTMNLASTRKFISYIESRCLEHSDDRGANHG